MPKNKSLNSSLNYHELSLQLDETVSKLQDPNIDVDSAVKYYEQAMELIKQLEKCLKQAENRVREISGKFSD